MVEGRFVRQTGLAEVGEVGQERLSKSRALVIGAGGTGSAAILCLAGAGLRTLNICEPDSVEESNLHRQALYTNTQIGLRKAPIASRRVDQSGFTSSTYSIHPFKRQHENSIYKTNHVTHELPYDVVLDCTDRWSAHDEVIGYYREKKVPVVHGSIQGLHGRVMTFTHDTPCWRCLHPEKPTGTKEGPRGTLGPVCGVVGSLIAMETLRILLGHGPQLAGNTLLYSAMNSQFEMMQRTFDPACSCRGVQDIAAASSG